MIKVPWLKKLLEKLIPQPNRFSWKVEIMDIANEKSGVTSNPNLISNSLC